MIPSSAIFDQSVMQHLLDLDPVVQDYRAFFSCLDWSLLDQWQAQRSSRGRPPIQKVPISKPLWFAFAKE